MPLSQTKCPDDTRPSISIDNDQTRPTGWKVRNENVSIRAEDQHQQSKALYKKKTGKIWKMSKKDAKMLAERKKNIKNYLSKKPSKADIKRRKMKKRKA